MSGACVGKHAGNRPVRQDAALMQHDHGIVVGDLVDEMRRP